MGNLYIIFFRFPIYFDYNIIKNVSVQVGLPPTVSIFNIKDNQPIQEAPLYFGGNGYLKFLLAFDDYEYNFKHAISIGYYFSSSSQNFNETRKTNSAYNTRDFTINDFYPLIKNSENLSLGWVFSKKIDKKTLFNFNIKYFYELQSPESLTNLFTLSSFINENDQIQQSTSTDNIALEDSSFSFFGIEKIIQKLFWTTNLEDPWIDKKNDHLEISLSIDTQLFLDYTIASFSIEGSLNPFIDLNWLYRFTDESLYKSHLLVSTGVIYNMTPFLYYLFTLNHFLWQEEAYDFKSSIHVNIVVTI